MSNEVKHTPGPWRWEFNASSKIIQLCGGRPCFDKTVMDFVRWGMGGAAPRFMGDDGGFLILHKLPDRKDWIAPFPGREHHANWCADVIHPDARLIAAAPDGLALARYAVDNPNFDSEVFDRMAREFIAKATGVTP
jgi:hypothetical protein